MATGQPGDGSKSLSIGKVLLPHAQENREKSEAGFVARPHLNSGLRLMLCHCVIIPCLGPRESHQAQEYQNPTIQERALAKRGEGRIGKDQEEPDQLNSSNFYVVGLGDPNLGNAISSLEMFSLAGGVNHMYLHEEKQKGPRSPECHLGAGCFPDPLRTLFRTTLHPDKLRYIEWKPEDTGVCECSKEIRRGKTGAIRLLFP